jgi:serralysin
MTTLHLQSCMCPLCAAAGGEHGAPVAARETLAAAAAEDPVGPQDRSALIAGNLFRWNLGERAGETTVVSFGFASRVPSYYEPDAEERHGFLPFTATQKAAVRTILAAIAEVVDIRFVETGPDDARMLFGNADLPPRVAGATYLAYLFDPAGGDVWIDRSYLDPRPGNFAWSTLIHEIGHALGLKHPGAYGPDDVGPFLGPEADSAQWTVMSYNRHPDGNGAEPRTLMGLDIAALQRLYGVNPEATAGNDRYAVAGPDRIETIWDAGGRDSLDASAEGAPVSIDLGEGAFSSIGTVRGKAAVDNIAIAFATAIEDAYGGRAGDVILGNALANLLDGGSGNDRLEGLGGADHLKGAAGNDTLAGGTGADRLEGGSGNDTYIADRTDTIVELAGGGADTVYAARSFALAEALENLVLLGRGTGQGNELGNRLTGSGAADKLYGFGGNDILDGGTGSDRLVGGEGNDRLIGGDGADKLWGGPGRDVFVLSDGARGADRVMDFQQGQDVIDARAAGLSAGDASVQELRSGALLRGPDGEILLRLAQAPLPDDIFFL